METTLLGIIAGLVSIILLLFRQLQASISNHIEHKIDKILDKLNGIEITLNEIKVILNDMRRGQNG